VKVKSASAAANLPSWFEDIPPGVVPRKPVVLKPGQAIFSQGDECNRVYYINHGIVKLSMVSPEGRSAVLSILGPGDLVGVECLTGDRTHQTSAVTLVRSTGFTVRRSVFMRLLHENPATAAQFVDYLVKRYVQVERELINYLVNTSEKRLARALILLDQYSREVDASILQTITQETLADIVGTTRSRVNWFMNRFREKGYIDYDEHSLKVHSSLREAFE
jgi:CRP/FNR family cyclic AMP-dependent transcriptional regulator